MRERESSRAIREHATVLLTEWLCSAGYEVEPAPTGLRIDLIIRRQGQNEEMVKVLAAAAPHHRGGTGSLGLHWLLSETAADCVALVDLSRSFCWMIPVSTFKMEAQPLADGRYHLDWIVVPLGKHSNKVPPESKFEEFELDGNPQPSDQAD